VFSISRSQVARMEENMLKTLSNQIAMELMSENQTNIYKKELEDALFDILKKAHYYGVSEVSHLRRFCNACLVDWPHKLSSWVPDDRIHKELSFPGREPELKLEILEAIYAKDIINK
jgi:hypothetical protein